MVLLSGCVWVNCKFYLFQAKLRELERKYELQAIKHEELTLEMTQLRHDAEKAKHRPQTHTIEIQTENHHRQSPVGVSTNTSQGQGHGPRPLSPVSVVPVSKTTMSRGISNGGQLPPSPRSRAHQAHMATPLLANGSHGNLSKSSSLGQSFHYFVVIWSCRL